MENNRAHFKCTKCKTEFTDNIGQSSCPKCGSLYIEWLNYDELFVKKHANSSNKNDKQKK